MLTEPAGENQWHALVRPGRKIAIGEHLVFPAPTGEIVLEADVLERGLYGDRLIEFAPVDDFFGMRSIASATCRCLPISTVTMQRKTASDTRPSIHRRRGSVAAPTAGLHFTPQILEALGARGVEIARITLHVGLGTFAPLRVERVDEVKLHRERYTLSAQLPTLSIAPSQKAGASSQSAPPSSVRWSTAPNNAARQSAQAAFRRDRNLHLARFQIPPRRRRCLPTSTFLNRAC